MTHTKWNHLQFWWLYSLSIVAPASCHLPSAIPHWPPLFVNTRCCVEGLKEGEGAVIRSNHLLNKTMTHKMESLTKLATLFPRHFSDRCPPPTIPLSPPSLRQPQCCVQGLEEGEGIVIISDHHLFRNMTHTKPNHLPCWQPHSLGFVVPTARRPQFPCHSLS